MAVCATPVARRLLRDACCTTPVARRLLHDARYLIMDRDPLYTARFRQLLKDSGTIPVRLTARSPNLNAFAERFVLSITSLQCYECLNKIIPLGEKHLRLAIKEYMEHYHIERNHQGLGSRIIQAEENVGRSKGAIKTRSRLGGFLNYYYCDAA